MNELKDEYKGSWFRIIWAGLVSGNLIGRLILFAQNQKLSETIQQKKNKKIKSTENLEETQQSFRQRERPGTHFSGLYGSFSQYYKYTNEKVAVTEEIVLDTIEIRHYKILNQTQSGLFSQKPPSEEKYQLHFGAQQEFYEDSIEEMEKDAENFQQVSIGFNYRGVGESTGIASSMDDLVRDGIMQVQRLLNKEGVKAENVTLSGHSLGAAVAILVAKHFYEQGINVKLFADRPFSSITDVILGHIRTIGSGGEFGKNSGNQESWIGMVLAVILTPLVKVVLWATGWDHNIAAAYQTLPKENKCATSAPGDPILSDYGSLYSAISDLEKHNVKLVFDPKNLDVHQKPLNQLVCLPQEFYLMSSEDELDFCTEEVGDVPILVKKSEGYALMLRFTEEMKAEFKEENQASDLSSFSYYDLYFKHNGDNDPLQIIPFPDLSESVKIKKVALSNEQRQAIALKMSISSYIVSKTFLAEKIYNNFMLSQPKPVITSAPVKTTNIQQQHPEQFSDLFPEGTQENTTVPVVNNSGKNVHLPRKTATS